MELGEPVSTKHHLAARWAMFLSSLCFSLPRFWAASLQWGGRPGAAHNMQMQDKCPHHHICPGCLGWPVSPQQLVCS